MTQNQIAFYKAKKEAQHYRRQDKEAKRHNVMTEALTAEDLSIKDWANRANVALGYENAAINRTHYAKSDFNNQVANQIKEDQVFLDYVTTFGAPTKVMTPDGVVSQPKGVAINDYYDPNASGVWNFNTSPVALNYVTPSNLGNLGKLLSGASAMLNVVDKVVNSVYYRGKSKGE